MLVIVTIEDNLHFDKALQQVIGQIPDACHIKNFSNAEAAIKELPALAPDLVIADIQLTGKLSGIDVIRLMKPLLPATEFLVCTVHDDSNLVFTALQHGASGYILKEASADEIKNAILEIANGGAPMSPFIARKVIASFQKSNHTTPSIYSDLTTREQQVIQLLAKGLLYKEIAGQLTIAHATVKKHLRNIYEKLHVQNKVEAVNKFRSL